MTEKDTKAEEAHDEEFYDDYNENDDYLISKALGNIKSDEGTARSRPRRIPLYYIQLDDEDKIPKMPEKILKEPNDDEFKKKIDALKEKNNEKSKSIQENIEKIKQEKMGVRSDDKDNPYEKKKVVNKKIKDLNIEINKLEQDIAPIRNKFTALSNKVKSYERYHFPNNPKRVAQDLKKIKEKISFAAINVTEETELIKRKAILEDYEKDLNEFIKFKNENNEALNKAKQPKDEKKKIICRKRKIRQRN